MTLTETLTQHPELIDELVNTLNWWPAADWRQLGNCWRIDADRDAYRALVLAWVQRVETTAAPESQKPAHAPAGDTSTPTKRGNQ